jgi:hypothetical protein
VSAFSSDGGGLRFSPRYARAAATPNAAPHRDALVARHSTLPSESRAAGCTVSAFFLLSGDSRIRMA